MKLLPRLEDIEKAKGARFINVNPHDFDLRNPRNMPAGWALNTWNCGRARCKALNYALFFIPPSKEIRQPKVEAPTMVKEIVLIQCRSCGQRSLQGTTKCPNCGASL